MPARKSKKASKKNEPNKKKENLFNVTNILTNYEDPTEDEYRMQFTDLRRQTFRNWPFDEDTPCNPQTLAEAGFYHIPTDQSPDATRCFCCYKELDCWEPDDNPWSEHKKRSPGCMFLSMRKDVTEFTMDEFIKLEFERQKHKKKKLLHLKLQEFDTQMELVRTEMLKLNPNA